MEKQIIVSIGREYGSGGHVMAEKIAKDLGLPLYDRNMLDAIAEEKNANVTELHKFDEKPRNLLFSRRVGEHSSSMEEHIAAMQFEYIRKKADSGESFVVVGRCAEAVLKDHEGLISIFVMGDKVAKIDRVMEKFHLSANEALIKMNRHDRTRKAYHNRYSEYKWGDSRGYDLCINSNKLGWEMTAELLEDYIKARMQSN